MDLDQDYSDYHISTLPDLDKQKRKTDIVAYVNALITIWTKAFGTENVASREYVKSALLSNKCLPKQGTAKLQDVGLTLHKHI